MKKINILIIILSVFLGFSSCTTTVRPTARTKVVYIKKPPRNHKVVFVNGHKYYVWNGHHHRKTRRGYVIVNIN